MAVVPVVRGGYTLECSVNGVSNTSCDVYIKNTSSSNLTNRRVDLIVFYVGSE